MQKKVLNLTGYQWTCVLYLAVAMFCWQLKYFRGIDNNYVIFRSSFYHALARLDLYDSYLGEYYDVFLYGPLFTLFIAPLAILPKAVGFLFWEIGNAAAFLWAVHLLPFTNKIKTAILLLCVIEFANAVHYMEFNPFITAMIILSWILVKKGKDQWAALLIVSGALMKIYPVIGLAFFMFSKRKGSFVLWTLLWTVVCLCLPAILSGPEFTLRSYLEWFMALSDKNQLNIALDSGQDWCVMGIARRLSQNPGLPNWPFLLAAGLVFAVPLFRFRQLNSWRFQLQVLCSALLIVVLFSTGSEHPTYIIAVAGVMIYVMMQEQPFSLLNQVFLLSTLVITGLGPTDVFPFAARDAMGALAMKAWPCFAVWCKIAYELLFHDFTAMAGFKHRSDRMSFIE